MISFRTLGRTTLLAAAATCLLGAPTRAQDDPAPTEESRDVESAHPVGPVAHPMFSERVSRHTAFVQTGGKAANTAVQLGLEWFKNHQNESGYWDAEKFSRECKLNRCGGPGGAVSDVGVTGAVLLAFLGAGETTIEGRYQDVVQRGLEYLRDTQDAEGCFGARTGAAWLHDHMWAAQAMTEAYGMSGSPVWKDSATRAVHFVLSAQNPYLGWGAGVRDGDNGTTMTALAMSVLHTAGAAGLVPVEPGVETKGALAWLHKMTDPESGRVGEITRGGDDDVSTFPQLQGLAPTAAAVLTRLRFDAPRSTDDSRAKGAALVRDAHPPRPGTSDDVTPDFTLWYWSTQAMFEAGREHWRNWRAPVREALISRQRRETGRDERGSWDTGDDHASNGGRLFVTALACLTLEVPYRCARDSGARR